MVVDYLSMSSVNFGRRPILALHHSHGEAPQPCVYCKSLPGDCRRGGRRCCRRNFCPFYTTRCVCRRRTRACKERESGAPDNRDLTPTTGESYIFGRMFDRAKLLAYIFEKSKPTFSGKKVDVLVMTEECVQVVCLSQDVSAPAVQHSNLQKGC